MRYKSGKVFTKVLTVLVAYMFLLVALNCTANPVIDDLKIEKAQTLDTNSFSYYENQHSEWGFPPDRTVEMTVYEHNTSNVVPNTNISVKWVSKGQFFEGNVWTGIIVGAIIGSIILGILTAGLYTAVAAWTISAAYGAVGGAAIGGVAGGYAASQEENYNFDESYTTDSNGKIKVTKSWQKDLDLVLDIPAETEIAGYSEFAPNGQPHWYPKHPDSNKESGGYMSVDIYLLKGDADAAYLKTLQKAQDKVNNLSYVETKSAGNWTDGTYFKAIDMRSALNAANYAELTGHDEFADPEFWRGRVSIYPDGKGNDILAVETKRLVYVKSNAGITKCGFNATYQNGIGSVMYQGTPAGAFDLGHETGGVIGTWVNGAGHYWYYQWVWIVGVANLTTPVIYVNAFIDINDGAILQEVGTDVLTIPDKRHVIEFTFSDGKMSQNVHHTVYAERSLPIIFGDIRYNYYASAGTLDVTAKGIQGFDDLWDTGEYGEVELFYPTCAYNLRFSVYNNDNILVMSTAWKTLSFNPDDVTSLSENINVGVIEYYRSYRIAIEIQEFGSVPMSQCLFYIFEDIDNHYSLIKSLDNALEETFQVGTGGTYPNFDNAHVNQIITAVNQMDTKIDLLQSRLDTFIRDKGASNYTERCEKMIYLFKYFKSEMNFYSGKSASDIAANIGAFNDFRALGHACLISYNDAYLYYSSAVAFEDGDREIPDDIVESKKYEERKLWEYYFGKTEGDRWDLTWLVIILIGLLVGYVAAYMFWRFYQKSFHKTGDRKVAVYLMGIFGAGFAITVIILYYFFFAPIDAIFGSITPLW